MSVIVEILLPTRNGEAYLADLLDSLLGQDCDGFTILALDDGSADHSEEILHQYAERSPRLSVMKSRRTKASSAVAAFSELLERSTAPYVMFCDQDDVWFANKISTTLAAMRHAEQSCPAMTPVLVHTDLQVVGQDLSPIADSFWSYQHLCPDTMDTLPRLLVQNVVTGCTTMINRALAELCGAIPAEAIMHDWWLALLAAACGRIEHIHEATLQYRQHPTNSVGAKAWNFSYVVSRGIRMFDRTALVDSLRRAEGQAIGFLERFGAQLQPEQAEIIADYASLSSRPWLERRRILMKHGLLKYGFFRNVGLMLRV